jgi:hypothetical protein
LAGVAALVTGCVTYPDGTTVLLPPPAPVVVAAPVAPVYAYSGGYRYYGTRCYGRPYYYGYNRPGWGGGYYRGGAYYRGGYYRRGYWR